MLGLKFEKVRSVRFGLIGQEYQPEHEFEDVLRIRDPQYIFSQDMEDMLSAAEGFKEKFELLKREYPVEEPFLGWEDMLIPESGQNAFQAKLQDIIVNHGFMPQFAKVAGINSVLKVSKVSDGDKSDQHYVFSEDDWKRLTDSEAVQSLFSLFNIRAEAKSVGHVLNVQLGDVQSAQYDARPIGRQVSPKYRAGAKKHQIAIANKIASKENIAYRAARMDYINGVLKGQNADSFALECWFGDPMFVCSEVQAGVKREAVSEGACCVAIERVGFGQP